MLHTLKFSRRAIFFASFSALLAMPVASQAQSASTRPLKLVIPTSPGSGADIGARIVGQSIQATTGRTVITENKVGAGGSIAAAAVAASEPNGETVGIQGNSYLQFPIQFPLQKFDPIQDVVPVAMVARVVNVLLVSSTSAYTSLANITDRARREPGKLSYASAGLGSVTHQSAERMLSAAAIDVVHIPYKGSPEAIQEVVAGRVDFSFAPYQTAVAFIQAGRVRVLAVSSPARSPLLPQVPTMEEAGLAGASYDIWMAAIVPARTPAASQAELNRAFNTALETSEIRARLASLGMEAVPMGLEQLQAYVRKEHEKVMKQAKATKTN